MATLYSNQYQDAFVDVPSDFIRSGDVSGEVKFMFFDFTVPGTAPTNGDKYKLGKIPKGARVIEAALSFPDLGTAGTLELGWAADAGAVETADDNGFLASVDVATAADTIKMSDNLANAAGFCKLFSAECDLELLVTTTWTATSGTVKGYLLYRTI